METEAHASEDFRVCGFSPTASDQACSEVYSLLELRSMYMAMAHMTISLGFRVVRLAAGKS